MKQWIFGISIIVFRKWMFSNIVYYGTMALWYDGAMHTRNLALTVILKPLYDVHVKVMK
jgi:hypothetical protein